jgi:hypothetical protein
LAKNRYISARTVLGSEFPWQQLTAVVRESLARDRGELDMLYDESETSFHHRGDLAAAPSFN